MILRYLLVFVAVFASHSAALSQPNDRLSRLLADAQFYSPSASSSGRPAEVDCFMRLAQRLDFDPNQVVRNWYKSHGMDDRRVVLIRLINLWAIVKDDAKLADLSDTAKEAISGITKDWPDGALDKTTKFTDSVKAKRGENDLIYATALEFVGDVQALQDHPKIAADIYTRVQKIRRGSVNNEELSGKLEDPRDDRVAVKNIGRVMSKLADMRWVLGDESIAKTLRSDVETKAGDIDRIADLQLADNSLRNKTPYNAEHPSCVAKFGIYIQ